MKHSIDVINKENTKVGTIELPSRVFSAKWNPELVHQVVIAHLANKRNPIAHAKTRGEVSGGGKKPWRQKHTGRARHGSTRSPIWEGGGVTHGPRNDRDFSKKVNKKMKTLALYSALSKKLSEGQIKIVDTLGFGAGKTKEYSAFLKIFFKGKVSAIFVTEKAKKDVVLGARNISGVSIIPASMLNAYECVSRKMIFIEKGAVENMNEKE